MAKKREAQSEKLFSSGVQFMALDRDASRREKDEKNGYLRVFGNPIIKAGVDTYYGREIIGYQKAGLEPDRPYRIYRPADELQKAVATADLIPILDEHDGNFSAQNYNKNQVVGAVGSPEWNPPFIRASLSIQSGEAISQVESGAKRALSPGYFYQLVSESGVSPDGEAYDFWMREIVMNHLALVRRGREGPDLMVLDTGERKMAEETKPVLSGTAARDEAGGGGDLFTKLHIPGIVPPEPATPAGSPREATDEEGEGGEGGGAGGGGEPEPDWKAVAMRLQHELEEILKKKDSTEMAMDTAKMIDKAADAKIAQFRAQIRERDAALSTVRDSLGVNVANRVQSMALDSGSEVIIESLKCVGIEPPPAGTAFSALEYIVKGIARAQKTGAVTSAGRMAMDSTDPDNAMFAELEKGRKLYNERRAY